MSYENHPLFTANLATIPEDLNAAGSKLLQAFAKLTEKPLSAESHRRLISVVSELYDDGCYKLAKAYLDNEDAERQGVYVPFLRVTIHPSKDTGRQVVSSIPPGTAVPVEGGQLVYGEGNHEVVQHLDPAQLPEAAPKDTVDALAVVAEAKLGKASAKIQRKGGAA